MGTDLETLKKIAETFKEDVWYYLECNKHKVTKNIQNLRDFVNDLLDEIDDLES